MRRTGKAIFLAALVLLTVTGCESSKTFTEPPVSEMSFVFEVPGKSAEELYIAANSWAVDSFRSAESVIEFSDKKAGMVKGSFTSTVGDYFSGYATARTTMTIETREGRARLLFTSPTMRWDGDTLFKPSGWVECEGVQLQELNVIWRVMADDLRASLSEEPEEW